MPALTAYRKDLARRAGVLKELTTGVLYQGAYAGTASGSDAARRIVSSDLAAVNRAGTAAEAPATAQNYRYVWAPTTGEQRKIVQNGYAPYNAASSVLTGHSASADAFIVGYVVLDRALAAALTGNVAVEIHQWPILANEERPGLHWAINEALGLIDWPRKVTITSVTGQTRYDVASAIPDLKQMGQLLRVYRAEEDAATGPDVMIGRPYLEPDAEKMYLHVPEGVTTGENFTVQARLPAKGWIRVDGTWASSTVGLVNETDEALPPVDEVTAVAWALIARRMSKKGPKPQSEEWAKEAAEAEAAVVDILANPVTPMTPRNRRTYRVPTHPTGKSWRPAVPGWRRGWP